MIVVFFTIDTVVGMIHWGLISNGKWLRSYGDGTYFNVSYNGLERHHWDCINVQVLFWEKTCHRRRFICVNGMDSVYKYLGEKCIQI